VKQNLYRIVAALGIVVAAGCDDPTSIARPIANHALLATSGGSGATQNGQSIMVTPTFDAFYIVQGSETWKLNLDAARTYYTTVVTGPVFVSCGGNAANCGAANTPPAPTAPAADPNEPSNAYFAASADKNRCTFWNGGDPDTPSSYTQDVTVPGANGNGNWKYRFTYTLIAPTGVAAKTAWDLISSTGTGDAEVELTGFIAGQSVVKKIKVAKNDWTFKVSHTINDGLGGHRVVGLGYSVDAGAVTLFDPLTQLQLETGVDFFYAQNSGNNGFTNLLVDGAMVNVIQNGGKAAYSGETDDFSGNNTTLGERVNFFGPTITLGAGTHSIVLTGTVKGNNGLGDLSINVTKNVTVDAQGCQN
jgi:hypothetical protein